VVKKARIGSLNYVQKKGEACRELCLCAPTLIRKMVTCPLPMADHDTLCLKLTSPVEVFLRRTLVSRIASTLSSHLQRDIGEGKNEREMIE
jgi:hypothetical protein